MQEVVKVRDLSLIPIDEYKSLVIACDSNASIGEKESDYKKAPYEEVAISAMKVPFMEVMATGAKPFLVVDNLCVEMESAGKNIISNMKAELNRRGYGNSVHLTGSTEDNMPTKQTGIGVTVIGYLDKNDSRIGKTLQGDKIVCVGIPKSGVYDYDSYSEYDDDIANIGTVNKLLALPYVHEILPVGSKGAWYEAQQLCETSGLKCKKVACNKIDAKRSAGSSTAVLCSLNEKDYSNLVASINAPCNIIADAY